VNETIGSPEFDFSRIGRNWDLVRIPRPRLVISTSGDVFQARFVIDDPAAGFYGLPGAPAEGTITAFLVYTRNSTYSRDRSVWTLVGRYPYHGGQTTGLATLVCPASMAVFLATAVEFDSGQVVTTYVSEGEFVDCDPYGAGAAAVRDGGPDGLFVAHDANGDLSLSWGRSCSYMDQDYELYEGAIGDWTSHVPRSCATHGRTATFTPPEGDVYYLVVPSEYEYEGSYGSATSGERPLGLSACRQRLVNLCPP
jgi:hypothetical protein